MFTSDGKYHEPKAFGDVKDMKLDYASFRAIRPHVELFYESAGYKPLLNLSPDSAGKPKLIYSDQPDDTPEINIREIH